MRQRKWRPYKATKKEVLAFFEEREVVTIYSLMDRFGYSYYGARNRLIFGGCAKPAPLVNQPPVITSLTASLRQLGVSSS